MILIFSKSSMDFCKNYQNAAILKIIKILKNCHGRFTANYLKFLWSHSIHWKIWYNFTPTFIKIWKIWALCYQIDFKRRNLALTRMQLRKKKVYFQYHLNCQGITDKWGDIELCLTWSNRKIVSAGWHLKFDQIDFNRRNLSLTWMQLRKKKVSFQYQLNCQDITDKWGDIELCLAGSNRKTVSAGWHLKFDQNNVIQRNKINVSLTWMQLRTKEVYFQYHLHCQDITDK